MGFIFNRPFIRQLLKNLNQNIDNYKLTRSVNRRVRSYVLKQCQHTFGKLLSPVSVRVFVSSGFSLILLSNLQQRLAVTVWHEGKPDTEAVALSNQKATLHLTFGKVTW